MWRNQFRSVRNRGRIRPACGAANKWNKDRCDGGPIQLTRTTNQLCEDHPLRREDRTGPKRQANYREVSGMTSTRKFLKADFGGGCPLFSKLNETVPATPGRGRTRKRTWRNRESNPGSQLKPCYKTDFSTSSYPQKNLSMDFFALDIKVDFIRVDIEKEMILPFGIDQKWFLSLP